jgi:hypothetical protein
MQKFTVIRASKALQKQRRAKSNKQTPKQVVLLNRRKQKKPRNQPRPPRQNQTRTITDFPLGTSQRNGFNRNTASKTITKDEYIGEVAGTVAFTTTQYAVNPGQAATFPWLSLEAKQWEKYEFEKLEFYLKPEVTQYTGDANSGKVILSFDSDASDAPPINKQEAEDVMPMADGMSYQSISLDIPKFILNSHHDSFYVRPANLPGGCDIKTYDLGNLFVSTLGQGAAISNMMELRVRYTCTLMIPILENTAAAPQNNSVTFLTDTVSGGFTTALAYQPLLADPPSSARPITNGNNVLNTNGLILPPPGNYILNCSMYANNNATAFTGILFSILKNGIIQNPTFSGGSTVGFNGLASGYITLNASTFLSCTGTDVIRLSITPFYTAGTVAITTTFQLLAT